ncbi:MAG: thioredoxin fold domain-containing protein [Candidatus Contendobacter sp.]|nr:thioredoxin fold domain-containing protein [Candidatus Contendobacter sp.]MDG4557847.1 thioredoxin fold domain-containing protein [Candidatus Contendobacter sp.]
MLRSALHLLAAAGLTVTTATSADEATVRAAVKTMAPNAHIESIADAAIPGLSEVVFDGKVVYISQDGNYMIRGKVLDIANQVDLTEQRMVTLRKVELAKIGPERRIRFAAKNEKYRVTVFTDIDCGFCRKLHTEIAQYNDRGITVDYLFFPRAGIDSESFTKAVNVWCAADQRAALTDAKAGKTIENRTCTNPVADDYNLGKKIGVSGTPAIFTDSGEHVGGYLSAAAMLERLSSQKGQLLNLFGYALAFAPLLLSLWWHGMNRAGTLAGVIVGAATVLLWKYYGWTELYEIVPGVVFASISIVLVSLWTRKPGEDVLSAVDQVDREVRG